MKLQLMIIFLYSNLTYINKFILPVLTITWSPEILLIKN